MNPCSVEWRLFDHSGSATPLLILLRYLFRQLVGATVAISSILLLVVISSRLSRYLADAASGKLAPDLLFAMIGYRIPGVLEVVLPLGFFLGVLLTYGRLHVDREMTALAACGFSERRLLLYTLLPALLTMVATAAVTLLYNPWGAAKAEQLLHRQLASNQFDALTSGRFQTDPHSGRVIYIGQSENGDLREVFVAERLADVSQHRGAIDDAPVVVVATAGRLDYDSTSGQRYLHLQAGTRYQGWPGEPQMRVTDFAELGLRIATATGEYQVRKLDSIPTAQLLDSHETSAAATLLWRLSPPLMAPIMVLIALPLSRVDPRQGRFARFLPAMLIYFTYLILLTTLRDLAAERGKLPPMVIWAVHGLFLAAGVWMSLLGSGRAFLQSGRARATR